MNELAAYQGGNLPAKPDELAKFIVVAQEKLKAVKAEIRAIRRLDMAKEVYDQKIEEQARLQELTLLAYQRMGEITREMSTSVGGRPSAKTLPASGKSFEKTKSEVIQDLGFSTSQVGRMEQMAAHPEIVEEVIAESQAGQTEATQTEVLRRIKERESGVIDLSQVREERTREGYQKIERDAKLLKDFRRAVDMAPLLTVTPEMLDAVVRAATDLADILGDLDRFIGKLSGIRNQLAERRMRCGKENHHAGNQGLHL